jgi:2-(1,2-epoxy-1,2-dihydrophenyl)acetyl-CoA isomerase
MEFRDILYKVEDGVARLTLNRPEKLNALTWGTWAEIETAMAMANDDDETRAVLITGAGRGFSAGSDLTAQGTEASWSPRPRSGRAAQMRTRFRGTSDVYHCRKPTIAAVNGVCVGAGFSLALACDIRIASEAARFSAIFVKRAIVADTGMTWFLPRTVGAQRAMEMMFTGRMVGGEEAQRIGLVLETVPADALESRALALATEIAHGPSVAIELIKRVTQETFSRDLDTQIEQEQFLQQITAQTEDVKEGRLSFIEKREPVFRGR